MIPIALSEVVKIPAGRSYSKNSGAHIYEVINSKTPRNRFSFLHRSLSRVHQDLDCKKKVHERYFVHGDFHGPPCWMITATRTMLVLLVHQSTKPLFNQVLNSNLGRYHTLNSSNPPCTNRFQNLRMNAIIGSRGCSRSIMSGKTCCDKRQTPYL